jgi:hypothetical protein
MARHRSAYLLAVAFACLTNPCSAQSNNIQYLVELCTAAISRPSNSATSFERQQWARSTTASMCQIGFNSAQSFRSAAGGLNLSVPVAGALFGLGASGNWSDAEVQQAFQQLCQQHQSVDMGDKVNFLQSEAISDAMASAYQFCIGKLSDIASALAPSRLIIRLTMSGENEFAFFAKNYGPAPITKITNVTGVKNCSVEGLSYASGSTISFSEPRNEFSGTCQRESPSDQSVALSASPMGLSRSYSPSAVKNG